jgi:Ig-like domain from next to BRCA1 gene/WD40-like Beta Propeller Repeat
MKNSLKFILLFAFLSLALTACAAILPVSDSAPTGVYSATPQPVSTQTVISDAQVEDVEIHVGQTDPYQVSAIVRGNLPDSCTTMQNPQVSFMDGTFRIELTVASPADRGCVQIATSYEQRVALDTANLTPGTYTVIANGVSAVFTIPGGEPPAASSLRLVIQDSDGNFQIANLDVLLNPTARPTFNGFLPSGGSAAGNAYVLDPNHLKAVVTDGNQFRDLIFVQSPTNYGLAVWPGDAYTSPRLAWATQNLGGDSSSTIKLSNPDGTQFDTLLTQDALNPPSQLMVEFFSADGQWLYFSKEPVGLGGYILFSGGSNLYKINIDTKKVSEVIPQVSTSGPQACLDAISADYRYVADHCAQNTIAIRNLTSGETTIIQPPTDLTGYGFVGSARFSPDGSRVAYALGKGDQNAEQGWVAVSEGLNGGSKLILTSQAGSYYTVAGWLDDQTLLVQTTNPLDCSPFCKSELWTIKVDGSEARKVADGSFLAMVPNDAIIQLPVEPPPTQSTSSCTNSAKYISDDGLDGTSYAPNTAFTKTWTIKNIGTCTWDSSYLVYQISGAYMTQQPGYLLVQQGQTVQPGQTVDISIGMTSPPDNGNYRSSWVLKNDDDQVIPLEGGAEGNSFFVDINVDDGTEDGAVTSTAIDIVQEQGSGDACTANATYFVHAYISTNGPTSVSYEIGSSSGQISAGYFEKNGELSPYISSTLDFTQAATKTINLRFVGPYPYPDDISVILRVNGGAWVKTRLDCP